MTREKRLQGIFPSIFIQLLKSRKNPYLVPRKIEYISAHAFIREEKFEYPLVPFEIDQHSLKNISQNKGLHLFGA